MQENFRKEGLPPISFGGMTGNSFNSHRLIWKAGQLGSEPQNVAVEELMRSYFCDEQFLNDPSVLIAAGSKAGITVSVTNCSFGLHVQASDFVSKIKCNVFRIL